MTLETAKSAGYCFGVARAVKAVTELSASGGLCAYGPLINNRIATEELERLGVPVIEDMDQAEAGGWKVAIRSHGVPEEVYRELERRGLEYIDCTCPDVKKIHKIARESKNAGRILMIIGDGAHPEVRGIVSYAGKAGVYAGLEELREVNFSDENKYAAVFQTTYDRRKFLEICAWLKGLKAARPGLDLEIHGPACGAAAARQAEAEAISRRSDVMIVLGDPSSSNTNKLYKICQENCGRSYMIETIKELQLNILKPGDRIGLTAGASTPPGITKEAVEFMSDLISNVNSGDANGVNSDNIGAVSGANGASGEGGAGKGADSGANAAAGRGVNGQTFEEMLDDALVTLHTGDVVKGTVIQVTPTEVSVNLGFKSDGIIMKSEITDDPAADISKIVKPGDVLDVYVIRVNDGEGNVLLSKKKIDAQKSIAEVEEAFQNKTTIRAKITEVVKGGVLADVKGVRAFIPSRQVSDRYVEDLATLKGKTFNFNVLEFDKAKKRVVAGRRELAAAERERAQTELFARVEPGQRVEGVVSRVTAFGAFVDLGGVDGLIHISELAWSRVRKVTDVVKEGDKVVAYVIAVDPEKGKISLSLRHLTEDPWKTTALKYPVGAVVEGKVVRLVPFGAFVELEDGVDGLIHISQIAQRHVAKPEDELTVGETVKVRVTEVNEEAKKISLSKREADGIAEREAEEAPGEELEIKVVWDQEDIEAVSQLAKEIWTEYYTPIIGAAQVEYMLDKFQSAGVIEKQIKEEGYRYYLAVAEHPAGYCAVKFDPETREASLSKIYVQADFRNRGMAKAMLDVFTADFEPVSAITLTVNKNNTSAITAYERMGFKITEPVVIDIGGGFVMDDYRMVLKLEEQA